MILVDADIVLYAASAAHPRKFVSALFLEAVAMGRVRGVVDTEVLVGILNVCDALGRRAEAGRAFDLTRTLFPVVLPVTDAIVVRARALRDEHPELSAGGGVHAAIVLEHGLEGICSFDRDLDVVPGLTRIEP